MSKKVCMVGPDPSVMGGISTVVKGYLKSDLVKDYDIKYISSHMDGGKVFKLGVGIKAYSKFINECINNKPNIVHIHSSFGPSFYRKSIFIIISRIFKIKVLNHIHGADIKVLYKDNSLIKKAIVKKVYSICHKNIVLTKEWEAKFKEILDKGKIILLENFAVIPCEITPISERKDYVLFLGEIGKRKGAYDIPLVVEEVVKTHKNIKFIICGNGDSKTLIETFRMMKLEKYVEVKGWIGEEEKKEYLLKSKVYFLPSYNEGLPMSILEAMSYGLPVVATDVGGITTAVNNYENGFIFEAGKIKEFAWAICELFKNEELYTVISMNNYYKIKNNFSLDSCIKKLKVIYHELLISGEN